MATKVKPTKTPSSQFAEVRASQQTSSGINPEHMEAGYAGSLSQEEYDWKLYQTQVLTEIYPF